MLSTFLGLPKTGQPSLSWKKNELIANAGWAVKKLLLSSEDAAEGAPHGFHSGWFILSLFLTHELHALLHWWRDSVTHVRQPGERESGMAISHLKGQEFVKQPETS